MQSSSYILILAALQFDIRVILLEAALPTEKRNEFIDRSPNYIQLGLALPNLRFVWEG